MNLGKDELNNILNNTSINDALNKIGDLDSVKNALLSGNIEQLGNIGEELSSICSDLMNYSGNLPGELANVINGLPDNFSNIVSGLGGIPDMISIDNLTNIASDAFDNVTRNDFNKYIRFIKFSNKCNFLIGSVLFLACSIEEIMKELRVLLYQKNIFRRNKMLAVKNENYILTYDDESIIIEDKKNNSIKFFYFRKWIKKFWNNPEKTLM